MDSVSIALVSLAAMLLVGVGGRALFARTGIPEVVWLIVLGVVLGPVTGLLDRAMLLEAAPHVGSVALIAVLFDGGSELRLERMGASAARSAMLAGACFFASVAAIAPTVMIAKWLGVVPPTWGWMHAILVGAIVGGASSVVVLPALRRGGVAPALSRLVNFETALTDVLAVVTVGAILAVMVARAEGGDGVSAAMALARSFVVGTLVGCVFGGVGVLVLRRAPESELVYPATLGGLLLLAVISEALGGSGALGVLAAAVVLGNAPHVPRTLGLARTETDQTEAGPRRPDLLRFLIQSVFFTLVGAMLGPPWDAMLFGLCLGLILIVARTPAAALGSLGSGWSLEARQLLSFLFPRGMAAGALAILPFAAGLPGTRHLPSIVFAAIATTVVVFSVGFPLLARRLPSSERAPREPRTEGAGAESNRPPLMPPPSPTPPGPPPPSAPFGDEAETRKRKRLRGPDGLARPPGDDSSAPGGQSARSTRETISVKRVDAPPADDERYSDE